MLGGNPALNQNTFNRPYEQADRGSVMTLESTAFKAATLVGITVITASVSWSMVVNSGMSAAMPCMIGGLIGGLVFALITIFKPQASPITAPLYAAAEGLFLGGVSVVYDSAFGSSASGETSPFSGIVTQAVALTLGVLATMLALYMTRVIRVTDKLRTGIIAATGAVCLVYVVAIVMRLFGAEMPFLHSTGPIGIGISLLIVGIASFNLLLDFDLIERGVRQGAPKYMEWYAGFALLVTLVWLYLEILRLLSKLRER